MSAIAHSTKSRVQKAQNGRREIFQLGILLLVFFVLLFIFSPYVRGSDQYWYVGDVERVVLQDGLYKSNSVFPASLPLDLSLLPRPWVQNKPVSYLVLMIAQITRNGQSAWLLLNGICLFASAWFVAKILSIEGQKRIWFFGFFLFFPLNFYLATQALPEIFLVLLISIIHYLIIRAKPGFNNILLLGLIGGLLICQRPNYMLLLILVPVLLFVMYQKRSWWMSLVFTCSALGIAIAGSWILKEHLIRIPSMLDTVLNNVPGKTNMGNFLYEYDNSHLSLMQMIGILLRKLLGTLQIQFEIVGMATLIFYLINLMMVAAIFFIVKKRWNEPPVIVSLVFIAIHLITIVLFYNQYRYAAAIVPSLFILNVMLFRNFKLAAKSKQLVIYAILIFFTLTSFAIGFQVRKDGINEHKMVLAIQRTAAEFHVRSVMCEWNNGGCLSAGYALSPALVFYFPKDDTLPQWVSVTKKLDAQYAIFYSKSTLYHSIRPFIRKEINIQDTNINFVEFSFPQSGGAEENLNRQINVR